MDAGIGRVLQALDDNDVADNTLVAYLYDHGGRHLVNSAPLFHGFANLFEGGIRVPAILRYPGHLPAGKAESIPAIAMDLTATILNAANLGEIASTLDGVGLSPLPSERAQMSRRRLYWQADLYDFGKQRAILDGRYKYIEHGNTQFLFDLKNDVGERTNLFYQQTDIANRLRTALTTWQQSHQAD
jgi:arylsulfatase A-like enzyme